MVHLRALTEKSDDAALLRKMIGYTVERLMDPEEGAKLNTG